MTVKAVRTTTIVQTATAIVEITVTRNNNGPVFQNLNNLRQYTLTIEETETRPYDLLTVLATDADQVFIVY